MRPPHQAPVWATLAVLTCAAAGCSEPRHAGNGVVRFDDGEPVRAGSVELRSLDGKRHYAARIGRDGEFSLTDRDGAAGIPAGEYQAVVVLIVMTERLAAADHDHDHGRNVPARYADYHTSDLRVDVSVDGPPIEIVLAKQ